MGGGVGGGEGEEAGEGAAEVVVEVSDHFSLQYPPIHLSRVSQINSIFLPQSPYPYTEGPSVHSCDSDRLFTVA